MKRGGDLGKVRFGSHRVQGSGFKVQGSRFRVQGSRFRVQGSGFRVQGSVDSVGSTGSMGAVRRIKRGSAAKFQNIGNTDNDLISASLVFKSLVIQDSSS